MKFTYSVKVRKDGIARVARDMVPKEKFLEHMFGRREIVKRSMSTPCWEWTGCRNKRGYGTVMFQGKVWRTSRLAWFLAKGHHPGNMEVCHQCDNPPCFNPEHLFLGTHSDNMENAASKSRLVSHKGEDHGCAKLTEIDVKEIRRLYVPRTNSRHVLAKRFNVSHNTIWMIANKRMWRHVD